MAYQTYTTEAIVCGSRAQNTSDKSFLLFTKDAGMVWASARSVREERSKQRFALQDFSFVRVSLVRGKSGWRVGSVENELNLFSAAPTREVRGALIKVVKLLRQFLRGEEPNPVLYDDVRYALLTLVRGDGETIERFVNQFTLRFLHKLGYIASHESFDDLLTRTDWALIHEDLPKEGVNAIKNALEASQL